MQATAQGSLINQTCGVYPDSISDTGIFAEYTQNNLDSDVNSLAAFYVDTLSVDSDVFLNAVCNTKGKVNFQNGHFRFSQTICVK